MRNYVWFEEENAFLKVYARDYHTLNMFEKNINSLINEVEIPVPAKVFKSNRVFEQLLAVEASFDGKADIKLNPAANMIHIISTSYTNVQKQIENLFAVENFYISRDHHSSCRQFFWKIKQLIEKRYPAELSEVEEYDYMWVLKADKRTIIQSRDELAYLMESMGSIISKTRTYITDETKDTLIVSLQSIDEASKCAISATETVIRSGQFKGCIDLRDIIRCRSWTFSCETIVNLQNCNLRQHDWMLKDSLVVEILPVQGK